MLTCECGFQCSRPQNLKRHRESRKHDLNMFILESEMTPNEYGNYECELCDYLTHHRGNYRKHMYSIKHKEELKNKMEFDAKIQAQAKLEMEAKAKAEAESNTSATKAEPVLLIEVMELFLKHQTEMLRVNAGTSESQQIQHTEMFRALTDRVVAHQQQQQMTSSSLPQNVMLDQANSQNTTTSTNNSQNTTTTNSHNKKFNLNLFLNEECKNAQNLTDFVKNVVISLEDLEHLGEVGYTQGMSKILSKAMQSKDQTERPMHCTDVKRETIYIRENDAWKKDMQQEQTVKAIEHIAHKNYKTFKEWRDLHPEHAVADTEDYETWYRISRSMCNTDPSNVKKLVHHLATITAIEKGELVL